jgi:hypothetical protein
MGNQPSVQKIDEVKTRLETVYSDILSKENVRKTMDQEYCGNLKMFLTNDILKKYSKDVLGDLSKQVILGIEQGAQNNLDQKHNELCQKLSTYYVKKINLVGTIINTIRLAHLKIDRIKNGGMCYSKNLLSGSGIGLEIPIQPSIPFNMEMNNDLIFLDKELIEMRKKVLEKAGLYNSKKVGDNDELLNVLAMVEIDNEEDCTRNGGRWLANRKDMEKVYLVPTPELVKENKDWLEQAKKMENAAYSKIASLITILDSVIEERVEPRMNNGREERIKVFRDRLVYDKDLDSLVIKTKKQISELFQELDTMYLILFSIKVVGPEHLAEMAKLEKELTELKKRGKK